MKEVELFDGKPRDELMDAKFIAACWGRRYGASHRPSRKKSP